MDTACALLLPTCCHLRKTLGRLVKTDRTRVTGAGASCLFYKKSRVLGSAGMERVSFILAWSRTDRQKKSKLSTYFAVKVYFA